MTHPGIDVIRQVLGTDRVDEPDLIARREGLAALAGSPPPPDGVTAERIELAERGAERLTPEGANDDDVVLYLHGGGYCSGSLDTHRGIAGALAKAAGRTVITLDYRLAPEDPFQAALNDALLAFDQLARGEAFRRCGSHRWSCPKIQIRSATLLLSRNLFRQSRGPSC